jgi:integrase
MAGYLARQSVTCIAMERAVRHRESRRKRSTRKINSPIKRRLRDAFGTRCFDAGIPAQEVQKLMGHETPAMTMRYSRVRDHRLHDAISRLGEHND